MKMIKNRKDLKHYLREDGKRNGIVSLPKYYAQLLYGSEHAHVYRYLRTLRLLEYCTNSSSYVLRKIVRLFLIYRYRRLGLRYNLSIQVNCVGYGFRIIHLAGGGGAIVNCRKMGNYCGVNSGVIIGVNGGEDFKPTIGDYVAFGPGAKAFGDVSIGNNVFVAANSVVTKDIPDNSIVGGIPAKLIKNKPLKEESAN